MVKRFTQTLPQTRSSNGQWHRRRCALVNRGIKIRIIMRYYFIPTRRTKIQIIDNNKFSKWQGAKETLKFFKRVKIGKTALQSNLPLSINNSAQTVSLKNNMVVYRQCHSNMNLLFKVHNFLWINNIFLWT